MVCVLQINNIQMAFGIYMKNFFSRTRVVLKVLYIKSTFIRASLSNISIRFFSLNRYLSSIYYGFFSLAMSREAYAVLRGKKMYYEGCSGAYFCLVRNVHRLEKALCMPDRRPTFAKDYIQETVAAYNLLITKRVEIDNIQEQLYWATGVLNKYFSVVFFDSNIEKAQNLYIKAREKLDVNINGIGEGLIPYQRKSLPKSNVSFEELLILSKQRRSVRWYEDRKIDRELIDKAILIASMAPSACNRQPFEFKVFDEPELVKKEINIPMGTAGWSHEPPVVVAVVGQLRAYFSERDRHIIYIDGSLASMAFMYGLEALGLSSCPINFPDIAAREKMAKLTMGLMDDERVIMMIAVGYANPEGYIPYSQKKSLDQIRSYNKLC